jgi:hypothetical protein
VVDCDLPECFRKSFLRLAAESKGITIKEFYV